ncbi:MAG: Na/Pi symporter [Vicinamibacterales bacterium]|nr:Na/Pi symporter [Vicinamibacterales bacterium]
MPPAARGLLVVLFLYVFLVGIAFLEAGIASTGEAFQADLLRSVSHPISGLCAGLLATVLVQSSSVSTSTIVGLVGAGTLPVSLAIPMVMGANIGTTVTNTLASLGSLRRAEEFRRAFAAAIVHDFFNLFAVALLLPLELATGFLGRTADGLTDLLTDAGFETNQPQRSPIRLAVRLPVNWLSSQLGEGTLTSVILLALGLALIFLALALITRNMRRLVAQSVERAMNRFIGQGGGLFGILVGIGMTVAVQSSTITTSILVPLVAAGILTLRSAYPVTLGANVGATITALLASLAVLRPEGLTIALVHFLFNIVALGVVYPIPAVRMLPVRLAEFTADIAARRHTLVFAYVVGLFLVLPLAGVLFIR